MSALRAATRQLTLLLSLVSGSDGEYRGPDHSVSREGYDLQFARIGILREEIQFPTAPSLSGYSQVLTSLIRNKVLHGAVKTPGFENFLNFVETSLSSGTPEERLLAVALVCKVANTIKTTRGRIAQVLAGDALALPLPPLKLLSDSDDRFYAANIWRFSLRSWSLGFLTLGILDEESAEKSRRECAEGLLAETSGLEAAFRILEQNLSSLRFSTEDFNQWGSKRNRRVAPSDSMARRMRRVLLAIRDSFALIRKAPGEDVGPSLRSLLRKSFDSTGFPKDSAAKTELAKETIELILQIVRSRYALALLADTYSPIITIRDWFTESEWGDLSEDATAKDLAESIQAAIELLARSGTVDNSLFDLLVLASGSSQHARVMTREIIERNAGLSPEAIAWLSGQPVKKSTQLSTESLLVRVDETIGDTMLATLSASESAKAVQTDLLPELDVFQSLPRHLLDNFISRFSGVRMLVQALCDIRKLEPFGTINVVEEFSPLKHQFEIASDFGARLVRIVQPGVIVRLQDGTVSVVRKAIVEPEKRERNESR